MTNDKLQIPSFITYKHKLIKQMNKLLQVKIGQYMYNGIGHIAVLGWGGWEKLLLII